AAGGDALPIAGDIRDADAVDAAVAQAVERFGGIDLVVNNASAINLAPMRDLEVKRFDLMQQINSRGTFVVTRACLPHLRESDHAHVLTLSPPLSADPRWLRGHSAYTLSKMGMTMITLGVAADEAALSIHAPTDDLRQSLMPVNTKYPLASVIEAAKAFDRRVTFEYVMLGGVNDRLEDALNLARLAKECRAFVNLIPLHPGGAMGFTPTPADAIARFARELRREGVEVAVRKSRGKDIAAACGQLRVERLGRRPPRIAEENGHVEVA
ncbi:MAG TPA: SDR family NAD(P)-dependent oxidoreductase, partial [Gemmatimonadaceae bacterium]|nr:SDR family NAD(P)-dependent oxidoreductase [Gemmatimonadaceae bacterium]